MYKKSIYATLATLAAFTAFCGGVPGFGSSGKYPKSKPYESLNLGKGMSSEEMGTKGKKKLPKSKRNKHNKNKLKSHDKCYKKTVLVQEVLVHYKGGIK